MRKNCFTKFLPAAMMLLGMSFTVVSCGDLIDAFRDNPAPAPAPAPKPDEPTPDPTPAPDPTPTENIIAEIDWTQQTEYGDLWYSTDYAEVSVEQGTGLIINCTSDGTTNWWEPQVPIIGHLPDIGEGGHYQLKFDVNAPAAGEIRLDFCSWDGSGATKDAFIDVVEGDNSFTIDFEDYPTFCTNAMIFYQCGKVPGTHIIKKVQLIEVDPGTKYEIFASIDWTQETEYGDLWYTGGDLCTVDVTEDGLIIESTPEEDADYWNPQVPMIGYLPDITEGDEFVLKFTLVAPADGEIRLDFCSWDGSGATYGIVLPVYEGYTTWSIALEPYPTTCKDAMIFYQCGKMPGTHIIKDVKILRKI